MKTIHKFTLKSFLGPMILSFFIVMFVLMMNFLWRYIDELVGKGLDTSVILELMFYAAMTLIPMGLPLSTLFAAIMTMGNLGESYELLAMKSSGMSLPKILSPLAIIVCMVAISSFFVANNLVPYSMKKMQALIYDIRQQKQEIEFKDGTFFNGIENISIRVDKQHPETKLLTDVLIYDTRDLQGNMTTTVADSGYIKLSDDKRFLLITLYNGETYEQTRNYQWAERSSLRHHIFTEQNGVIPLAGFDFERTNTEMFSGSQTKNILELEEGIDSLRIFTQQATLRSYEPLLEGYIFTKNRALVSDSLAKLDTLARTPVVVADSISKLNIYDLKDLWNSARSNAYSSRQMFSFDEDTAKEALNQLYRFEVEWHRKMSLPISIMIFFLIGAPLGAIIRKGGLGMPIIVSVVFFVLYYMVSMTGEKMAKEGTWVASMGMWFATLILMPISAFLTYKATNDSNLFNTDWYIIQYRRLKTFLGKIKSKFSKN